MNNAMIEKRGTGLILCLGYVLFAVLSIRAAIHFNGIVVIAMPWIQATVYCFCAYFFIEIQRGKSNTFEKAMAYASGGVFVAKLALLLGGKLQIHPSKLVAFPWVVAALMIIATVSLVTRTVQLFKRHDAV